MTRDRLYSFYLTNAGELALKLLLQLC